MTIDSGTQFGAESDGRKADFIPTECDFLIVGGGAVGLAMAYNLARKSAGSVVLLDRRAFGTGATNKSGGGMRRIFSERVGTQVTLRSLDLLKTLESDIDVDPILHQVGYLYLLNRAEQEAEAARILEFVDELAPGTAGILSAAETAAEFPWLDPVGLTSSLWSPRDGYVDPTTYAAALTRGARHHGARLIQGVVVQSLETSGNRVTSVQTSAGAIEADVVILAASRGSVELARTAGVTLPIETHTSQRFVLDAVPPAERPYPFTFDLAQDWAGRGDGAGMMVGFSGEGQVFPSGESGVEWSDAKAKWYQVVRRLPQFAGLNITGGIFGTLDGTPDRYPLIGFDESVANLFLSCGFWGSGVMQSLGATDAASDLITTGGSSYVEIEQLDANRFRHGGGLPLHPYF